MSTEHATLTTLTLPDLAGEIAVTGFTGSEAMSALYRFDVRALVATAVEGFARRAVERPALFTIYAGGHAGGAAARTVCGIVSSCRATGHHEGSGAGVVFRIVPRMARMKQRRTSRIFQDQTTREIVEQVFALWHIPNRWHLARELPRRAYCVQYDETDYGFVTRLCASEGIFFSFESPSGTDGDNRAAAPARAGDVVVFADTVDAYAPIDGRSELRFRALGAGGSALRAGEDHVEDFRLRHAMRANRVLFRRFDFEKPLIPRRDAAGVEETPQVDPKDAMRAFVDTGATIYEHQQTREQALLDPVSAQTALEAEIADAVLAAAETACRRLLPGRSFRVADHSLPELDGHYVVVSCAHEGHSPQWARAEQQVYTNRFNAVPAGVPFRPARPRRKVRQSLETATVVGPAGQDIHTDELGRIKVQFHWDLQGGFNDTSSCWLRVAQPWAGSGYGTQFLPRVGHEVLVGYIDGDADRPVVLGSLHNGQNLTPFSFPRDLTQSGIKTRTSPDGQGGHELLFDDRAGAERVSLRSNRTMQLSAAEDAAVSAERNLRITSGADRADEVLGDASCKVAGDESRTTAGSRSTLVARNDALEVKGKRDVEVGGDEVHRVNGVSLQIVAGSRATIVGTGPHGAADDHLSVSGHYRVGSVRDLTLGSQQQVQLACGNSKITLYPDHIVIESLRIQLQAKEKIALVQGDPPQATLTLEGSAGLGGGTVSVAASGKDGAVGKLFLDADAHLDGSLVKLNCGPVAGGGAAVLHEGEEMGEVRFAVARDGIPADVDAVTLVIATPTGEIVERVCQVGGSVVMVGKKGDVFTVVETRIGDKPVPVQKKTSAPENE